MKHLKTLSLAAMAMALMAFVGVGTAAAGPTELYTGHTTASAGLVISASIPAGSSALLTDTSKEFADTCKTSTVEGKTSNTTAEQVTGAITALTWGNCTWATKTITEGSLDITYVGDVNGDGQGDGTVTGTGSEWTFQVFDFLDCTYKTGTGTHLGTLTGSTAGNATMDINAVIKTTDPFCPETALWTATYTVTTPTGLNVRQ